MKIHFIVNGEDIFTDISPNNENIESVVRQTLETSNNTGRPIKDWQIRDNGGNLIERVCELKENEKYFLSLNMCACHVCSIRNECQSNGKTTTDV